MNSNLKKGIGLLLIAGALVGCISVLAYVGGNSGSDSNDDSDNTTGGSVFRYNPLEFVDKFFAGKSNAYSETGSYELKLNVDNVNNFIQSADFGKIKEVVNIGAQSLASQDEYNLKYFDVYSTTKTNETNDEGKPYSITIRYRFEIEDSKTSDKFYFYEYPTPNTAKKETAYKAQADIKKLDVDFVIDSDNNNFIDIFDIDFYSSMSEINIHCDSFKLKSIDFKEDAEGISYFIKDDSLGLELTKMYDDPVERLTYFKKDIYPDMLYKDFFTAKKVEEVDPDNSNKKSYEKDIYTNREKNILRFVNGDLDRCVGGFYDMAMSGKAPVLWAVKTIDTYEITNYSNTANLIYRGKFKVIVNGAESTVELLMQVSLHNLDKLDEAKDDGDIIQSVTLFELRGTYKQILTASGDDIVYSQGYSNSTFVAYDMSIISNVKEELYLVDKYYSDIQGIANNYPEIKFDKHDFDINSYISIKPDGENELVLKQLTDNCDELDEIMSLFVSLC